MQINRTTKVTANIISPVDIRLFCLIYKRTKTI